MGDPVTRSKPVEPFRAERLKLWKVILRSGFFRPRDFATRVLMSDFRIAEAEALSVMLTAHPDGA
jgi:ATP-dependent Clp protease adaptor protein ClpS